MDDLNKENEIGEVCSTPGTLGSAYTILIGEPNGKKHLGGPSCKSKDNMVIESEGDLWFHLAQHRTQWWDLVNTVMNVHIPIKTRNFLTISFSSRTLLH
jgi:hypothetical protein